MLGSSSTVDAPSAGAADRASHAQASRVRLRTYTLLLLAIPLLFLGAAWPIVRADSFPRVSEDPFLLNLDYAFTLHADCEVVIFGDSTALTGVDPLTIRRMSGLDTCNISQTQSIIEIDGMMALDAYLSRNRAPRFLIMQFAPETLGHAPGIFWPEGLTLLLRRGAPRDIALTLLRHPVEAYDFAMWAIKSFVKAHTAHEDPFAGVSEAFLAHRGLLTLPKPAQRSCVRNLPYAPPQPQWVRELRARYARAGTQVLIDIAPVPDCTTDSARISAANAGLTDNSLPVFPVGLFCDLDRHMTLEGAERASADIARQILARLPGRNGTTAGSTP